MSDTAIQYESNQALLLAFGVDAVLNLHSLYKEANEDAAILNKANQLLDEISALKLELESILE